MEIFEEAGMVPDDEGDISVSTEVAEDVGVRLKYDGSILAAAKGIGGSGLDCMGDG